MDEKPSETKEAVSKMCGANSARNMRTSDFYYDLPKELIAQDALEDRTASRLLVVNRQTGEIRHEIFRNITKYLRAGDCLVLNNTRVLPARLMGIKEDMGDSGTFGMSVQASIKKEIKKEVINEVKEVKIEVLLLKRQQKDVWEVLVKPGRKAKPGTVINFGGGLLRGLVLETTKEGGRLIRFTYEGVFENVLEVLGEMPLPPYITHPLKDKNRYQTVYARQDGSAAAPTAGLHFTEELLVQVKEMGVQLAYVTLHVGLGTFRPVKAAYVREHHMHAEYYELSGEAAEVINRTRAAGGRVICVGTTGCRTVESAAGESGQEDVLRAVSGETEIFIYPGYRFRVTDGLITNFHLPESTLMMLVSALAGREHIMAAYEEAIRERYRFFSFGDAMLIL